jgi:hypothetical protein
MANYCRAVTKSLRGTKSIFLDLGVHHLTEFFVIFLRVGLFFNVEISFKKYIFFRFQDPRMVAAADRRQVSSRTI